MDPPTTDAPQGSDSEEIEEVPRFDDLTRQRIAAEREKAMEELEAALQRGDAVQLRAAITRGRKFRLPGLDEAAKVLRKTEKKATKQHKSEKRRGEVATLPAAAREDRKGPEPKKHFYVEKQQKNMCRMHALNAFYQRAKLNPDSFLNLCREFERSTGTSKGSSDYFYVEADGANILSFVVERDKRYLTVYFPPGTQADIDSLDEEAIVG